MKNLLIFASGSANGGGSGAGKLIENAISGKLEANIVGLISNHSSGGVYKLAQEFGIPFFHFISPEKEEYQYFFKRTKADFTALSGWIKHVIGLDPRNTFNIHPGPLPKFGGKGMYGHHVHEAVLNAYKNGKIKYSAVTMHFVTDEYDRGPICFEFDVPIYDSDTADTLGIRVNKYEHEWQYYVTNMIVTGKIYWDGKNPFSLVGKISQKDFFSL